MQNRSYSELTISPNPTVSGNLELKGDLSRIDYIHLYDTNGRLIQSYNELNSNLIQIDNTQSGLYLLDVHYVDNQPNHVFKVLVH